MGKNSRNSSKPPSSDGSTKPAPKSLRTAGQRPIGAPVGHKGDTLRQSLEVDALVQHFGPAHCSACACACACASTLQTFLAIEPHQVFELPQLRAQVTEHQHMRSVCPCGAVHTGEFPLQVSSLYPRGSPGLGAGVCRHYPKRGSQAVHDGLLNYKPLEGCAHGLCNAHHLRELVYIHEDFREKAFDGWAAEMGALLRQANSEVAAHNSPLAPERMAHYDSAWTGLLERGEHFNPRKEPSEGYARVQGRAKQSKQCNLLARLRTLRADVWRFATDRGVPLTNNLAEQALRMSKVRQKVSGCFRTDAGAKTFFVIRSYLQTMRKQQRCLFECLISVFNAQPAMPEFGT